MKTVTSMTVLTTAEGKRLSITFSEINDKGEIVRENNRKNVILIDSNLLSIVEELEEFAKSVVEDE